MIGSRPQSLASPRHPQSQFRPHAIAVLSVFPCAGPRPHFCTGPGPGAWAQSKNWVHAHKVGPAARRPGERGSVCGTSHLGDRACRDRQRTGAGWSAVQARWLVGGAGGRHARVGGVLTGGGRDRNVSIRTPKVRKAAVLFGLTWDHFLATTTRCF